MLLRNALSFLCQSVLQTSHIVDSVLAVLPCWPKLTQNKKLTDSFEVFLVLGDIYLHFFSDNMMKFLTKTFHSRSLKIVLCVIVS